MGKRSREERRAAAKDRKAAAEATPQMVPRMFAAIVMLVLGIIVTALGVVLALLHQSESLPVGVQDDGPSISLFADGDPFSTVSADLDARGAPSVTLRVTRGDEEDAQSPVHEKVNPPRHVWLIVSVPLGFEIRPATGLVFSDVKESGDGLIALTPAATQGRHTRLAISFELSDARPLTSLVIVSHTPAFIGNSGLIVTPMPSIQVGLRGGIKVVDSDTLATAVRSGDKTAMKLFRAATIDGVDVYPPLLHIRATASPYDLLNPETMVADVLLPQPSSFSPLGWTVTNAFRPYLQWRDLKWEAGQEQQAVIAAVLMGVGSGAFLAPFGLFFESERRRRERRKKA